MSELPEQAVREVAQHIHDNWVWTADTLRKLERELGAIVSSLESGEMLKAGLALGRLEANLRQARLWAEEKESQ